MNSRNCDLCNTDVHRASYSKHLRSKKHIENIKQNEMIIPEWLFKEPIENKIKKIYNPKSLKQLARNNINLDDKQLNKELAKKMINPYYFSDRNLQVAYKINLDSHHINHLNSKTISSNFENTGIEFRFINKIMREMSIIYARLINQYKFRYQTVFSARFDKQNEDGLLLDETEMYINLNINHNLTQGDIDNINITSPLERQIQNQEMQDSGWRFDKLYSMTIYFYKTTEMNGSNYVKIPLRSNAILNVENNDKYCFVWSVLAWLYPCKNNHPNRVSNYKKYFDKLNIQYFDFTNGFKCNDVHKFNKLNKISVNIFELVFYQDHNQWKHKLIPIEISKNDSDRVIDLAIYKNHYVLIKKLNIFLGDHNKNFICRRCLNSYTSENMLIKHKQKCGDDNITTIKTSNESHLHWKKHFHKNPLYFRVYADFEAVNEKDNTSIGNKTTNIYKQNPVLNGYHIVSELEDVLKSDYYKSPIGYDNVDWFVDEVIKLENKMAFYFKNTNKDIIMTDENEDDYRNDNICRFCETFIESDKIRDHCHLTGSYRGPAHSKCNINVSQKQSNFIPFIFHNFSNYDCHMFFKKLVDQKNDKVKFEIIPKTNEEYISVTYGCIRFIDSYRFLSSVLDSLVKTLVDNSNKTLKNFKDEIFDSDELMNIVNKIEKKYSDEIFNLDEDDKTIGKLKEYYPEEIKNLEEVFLDYIGENDLKILKDGFPDKWKFLTKKLAYPYEYFNSIDDYQKPVNDLQKEYFFSKLKNKCPDDEEIQRTMDIIEKFNIKNGEELTEVYLKSDVLLLACVFEKFIKMSIYEFDINPLYCVSLPGYTWQCGLKYTGINLQTLQDKDMILLLENNIRGGISSIMGDRYIKSNENKKILYIDANNLYGHSMSEPLPYDEIKFETDNVCLEDILNTPDDSDIGYFIEVDLKYPDNIKQKTKNFPFAPMNKKINPDNFNDYMKEMKPDTYTSTKKLICDWSDKKNYLVHYRILKFYIRHGMVVDKIHNIISFKQSRWLEKYINFNTQKRNQAKNDFEKDFYKLLNNAFYGKTMENVRNRLKIKFIKKDDYREIIKQQSKLTFNGIHKSYDNCDSYTFKQNEVLMDKPIYLGFAVLELSKLHMYETYYDVLQAYFRLENIQLHYMDCDSFVLSIETENIINDLKNLEDIFDFSNLNKNHKLFSNKNKKIGKFKIETPDNIWIDEFIALRSKCYAFKCGDDNKNKLKGISKSYSRDIKFDQYKKCLDGENYQKECDNYILRSINHDMILQKVKKSTLSIFDDKRCYINNTESIPWN